METLQEFLEWQDRDTLIQMILFNFCTIDDDCPDFPEYRNASREELIEFLIANRDRWSY